MKVLFFISSLRSGGAERVLSVVANQLIKRGYDVTVAVMSGGPVFYELDPLINVKKFMFVKNNNLFGKALNRFQMWKFIRKLCLSENPDVVISFIYQMNTNVILSTRFLGVPVICSEHNTLDKKMSFIESIQRIWIARLADRLTILTQHDYEYLGNKLPNKIVLPNPLSFETIDNYNEDRDKVILAVGSVKRYNHKGFDNLIKVWSQICDRYPDWKLQIVGDYDEKSLGFLKSIEENLNTNNKVQFLGQIKNIKELLRKSSIFVLSSRWEGLPMVLMEAMSQGCTCISYDLISGPNEIIKHDYDGILVENQNHELLKNELESLILNRKKRIQLSSQAIKSIKRFSADAVVSQWEKMFEELKVN